MSPYQAFTPLKIPYCVRNCAKRLRRDPCDESVTQMSQMDELLQNYSHMDQFIANTWLLLSEAGPCLKQTSRDASKLMLRSDLQPKQLNESLITVFENAAARISTYGMGLSCEQPARLFSMCALLSQLRDQADQADEEASERDETAFHLNDVVKSDTDQASVMLKAVQQAEKVVQHVIKALKKESCEHIHTIRKHVLVQTFGKSIFIATLDSAYAGVFGKQLNAMLMEDRIIDHMDENVGMSSRLSEMWMDSSQCCKYGSLLRIQAQILLLAKLLSGESLMRPHVQELLKGLIPTTADEDVCNRGSFCHLRTKIVDHLIAPCCDPKMANSIATALDEAHLGELTMLAYQCSSKSSLVELASTFLKDSNDDNAMTSLASALTVGAYGLLGNDNVHTHKNPTTVSSLRWKTLAFEDEILRRKANPSNDNKNSALQEPVESLNEDETAAITRWTSFRQRELLEMQRYREIFHISDPLRNDPLVMQLRCLTRAYFRYATFKASQADAGMRSWVGIASTTYRSLLTAPQLDKSLLCPQIRKPDTRRAQFLQCATLMLMHCSVNDISSERVSMTRLEAQLDALALFNKALFGSMNMQHLILCNHRFDKRWGAKIVGSFTPMLAFLLSNTLHEALLQTFETLRAELQTGTLALDASFPDVGELMDRLANSAQSELRKSKLRTEVCTEVSFEDKKALKFALRVQEDVWRVAPRVDGWVNVLHFRSCRGSEKRSRDDM